MSFFAEIRRRKVFQVAAVYAVVAWLIMQVVDVVNEPLNLPGWFDTVAILMLAIGFPIALILSWAFDITSEGVVRDTGGTTPSSGRAIEYALISLLVFAVCWLLYRDISPEEVAETAASVASEGVIAPDRQSIAALPFANESAAAENAEFVANGIHAELITQLMKISDLKVISETSVREYRDTTKNMRQIGRELGVSAILEGRVQVAGDAVRINVQLIDAETDADLWAETYNRALTAENIFAIQAEMATAIAGELEATLLPEEVARLNEIPTQNARALEFYLTGNDYARNRLFLRAAEMYQRAVEEDPSFALAYAGLSFAHADIHWFALDPGVAHRELALAAVDSAFELDSNLPEAHFAMANYRYHGERDYEGALAELAIAEQALPGNSDLHFTRGAVLRRLGRFDEALISFDRATELDPRFTENLLDIASTFIALRNYDEAFERLERLKAIAPESSRTAGLIDMIPLWRDGDERPILAAYETGQLDGGSFARDVFRGIEWTGYLYAEDHQRALEYLDNLSEDSVSRGRRRYLPKASAYGMIYRLMDEPELSRQYYETALGQVDSELAATVDPDAQAEAVLLSARGEILAGLDRRDEALAMADRVMALLPESVDAYSSANVRLGATLGIRLRAGDFETAIAELDSYFVGPGVFTIEGLLPDPRLEPIRDDPRFLALVEKYGRR